MSFELFDVILVLDDDDNIVLHIAAETAKMIRENFKVLVVEA